MWPVYCQHKFQLWNERELEDEYHCTKCGLSKTVKKNDWGQETLWAIKQIKDTPTNAD